MNRKSVLGLLLLTLLLVGCQSPGVSKSPTDYTVMAVVGASQFKISGYLTEQNPEVKSALDLTNQFLEIYLNQDYRYLSLEGDARSLMTTTTIGDVLAGHIKDYTDNQVAVSLVDLSLGKITFVSGTGGKLVSATVQALATVKYGHATSVWLRSRNATLDLDHGIAFTIQLSKEEDVWKVWVVSESQAGN